MSASLTRNISSLKYPKLLNDLSTSHLLPHMDQLMIGFCKPHYHFYRIGDNTFPSGPLCGKIAEFAQAQMIETSLLSYKSEEIFVPGSMDLLASPIFLYGDEDDEAYEKMRNGKLPMNQRLKMYTWTKPTIIKDTGRSLIVGTQEINQIDTCRIALQICTTRYTTVLPEVSKEAIASIINCKNPLLLPAKHTLDAILEHPERRTELIEALTGRL